MGKNLRDPKVPKGFDAKPSIQFLYRLKLPTRAAGSSGSSFLSFPQSLDGLGIEILQPKDLIPHSQVDELLY